jgi:hypothetical protein
MHNILGLFYNNIFYFLYKVFLFSPSLELFFLSFFISEYFAWKALKLILYKGTYVLF